MCCGSSVNKFDQSTRSVLGSSSTQAYPSRLLVAWLVGCLTSRQHAKVLQERICSDHCTCCHTEMFDLLVGCLTFKQHASVSQGRICSDNFPCCHTEIELADQTIHLTQSQYTDTGPTSPSTDPLTLSV